MPLIAALTPREHHVWHTDEIVEPVRFDVSADLVGIRRLHGDGRILTTDWSKYDGKKHCVFEPARMSPAQLEAETEWVARRFYSPRSIARRLAGSRVGLWWSLPRNVGYMLAGLSNAAPSWDPAE